MRRPVYACSFYNTRCYKITSYGNFLFLASLPGRDSKVPIKAHDRRHSVPNTSHRTEGHLFFDTSSIERREAPFMGFRNVLGATCPGPRHVVSVTQSYPYRDLVLVSSLSSSLAIGISALYPGLAPSQQLRTASLMVITAVELSITYRSVTSCRQNPFLQLLLTDFQTPCQ
jgi:hypothetical protein